MGSHKESLLNAINESVEELQRGIDNYRCLVTSVLEDRIDDRDLQHIMHTMHTGTPGSSESKLRQALMEAIEVLEESRKAFKSKKLELLRKRLTQVLIDAK